VNCGRCGSNPAGVSTFRLGVGSMADCKHRNKGKSAVDEGDHWACEEFCCDCKETLRSWEEPK
jgi:hypothetical protein